MMTFMIILLFAAIAIILYLFHKYSEVSEELYQMRTHRMDGFERIDVHYCVSESDMMKHHSEKELYSAILNMISRQMGNDILKSLGEPKRSTNTIGGARYDYSILVKRND